MPTKTASAPMPASSPARETEGILLKGDSSLKAISVITDYSVGGSEDGDAKELPGDTEVSRRFSIILKGSATVGEVNAILNEIQARIVWSAKNSPNIEIRIPESKDPHKAQSTLEFLKNQKNVITFAVIVEE